MIVVTNPSGTFRSFLLTQLDGTEADIKTADNTDDLRKILHEHQDEIELVLLGADLDTDVAIEAAHTLQALLPEVSLILFTDHVTTDILQRAIRAGIKDVLPTSFGESELHDAIERGQSLTGQLRHGHNPADQVSTKSHKVITVFSSKGGSGKSFLSSNLAVVLAKKTKEQVMLLDLDLQSGDLAIMLQVSPAWTMYEVAQHLGRLESDQLQRFDSEAMRGYLSLHSSGIFLLPAPLDPALSEAISGEMVHQILRTLKSTFPYVVIDGPAYFTDQLLAALDESDVCILIASMDVPSIKNLKLALQTLNQLGFPREQIRVVLNRADSKVGLQISEVEKSLGTRVDCAIPSSRDVPLSINQGVPLAELKRKSPVISAIGRLAETIHVSEAQSKP